MATNKGNKAAAQNKPVKPAKPVEKVGSEALKIACVVQKRFRDAATKAVYEVGETVWLEPERAENAIRKELVKLDIQPTQAAPATTDDAPAGDKANSGEDEKKTEGKGDEAGTGAGTTEQ